MDTLTRLQGIFNEIQACDSRRFAENMRVALDVIPSDNSFLRIIDTILLCQRNSPPPRVQHFLKRVLEELSETNGSIFQIILAYLAEKTGCKSVKVRKNALRLISTMLSIQGGCSDNDLLAKIAEKLFDREPGVRKEALKMCMRYQTQYLSSSLTVQAAIKDIIRYDPSHEVRRIGFLGLEMNETTLNCILERCIDSSTSIRKAFWMQYFPKMDLSRLKYPQRIYLMKKGMGEREFNAKDIFLDKIRNYGLEQYIEDFYCEDKEYEMCIEEFLKGSTEQYEMKRYTPNYLHFLSCYYKVVEEKEGRDSLNLPPLGKFLEIFYSKCVELERSAAASSVRDSELKVLKYFLKILGFYDLFAEAERKYVHSIVNHIVLSYGLIPLAEECIILLTKTYDTGLEKITGSLIKKTRGTPICFALCEAVMKHLPLGEIHGAILSEIAILDIEQSADMFFWYYVKNPNPNIEAQYLEMLPAKKVMEGCADLVLMNILDAEKVEGVFATQLVRFNQHCVIPVCKLLLGRKICSHDYVKALLLMYYSTDAEYIQQYLSLFFFEYFRTTPDLLIDAFCEVLALITANHRIFVDQTLFWLSNSESSLVRQSLYLSICVFIHNNYDELNNRKHYFSALSCITPDSSWDALTSKKIITVLGLIIRKRPRENVSVLLNQVIEVDDGTPLAPDVFERLRDTLRIDPNA